MPHLTLEHHESAFTSAQSDSLLEKLQKCLGVLPTIKPENLKMRSVRFQSGWAGLEKKPYLNATFKLLPGRDDELKQTIAAAIKSEIHDFMLSEKSAEASITVEIVDLEIYL